MRTKGFTLIELMIVVAIIAIIAAIAIPSLLRSRMAANETAAAAATKAYAEAQEIFHRTDWDQDGVLEYSTRMGGDGYLSANAPAVADGAGPLTYPLPNLVDHLVVDDGVTGLIDRAFANAEGAPSVGAPKAGYVFSPIYRRQVGGSAVNYQIAGQAGPPDTQGSMTLGYAVSAVPGDYDGTGRNVFMISATGTIYQRDPGSIASAVHQTNFYPADTAAAPPWLPSE
jgi:prepilin-type N-terminal cleavage/methylation domain-containing protein